MMLAATPRLTLPSLGLSVSLALSLLWPVSARAETTAFAQSLAVGASSDEAVAEWYRSTGYDTLWTGPDDAARRAALLAAFETADLHGLPMARYDAAALRTALAEARTEGDRGRAELDLTLAYLAWAHDLSSGALDPATIDPGIVREIARDAPEVHLARIANGDPVAVLAGLQPTSRAYIQLMRAKLDLEAVIASGGWGPALEARTLSPGETGPGVVALRDRLVAMGYLAPTSTASYDRALQAAVQAFQLAHGLVADGTLGETSIVELNRPPEDRLRSVVVALERERWLDIDRDERHIWVNLPDFSAQIVEGGQVVFKTRSVIGKDVAEQHTPEFSDEMDHLVINPSWGVPRSIIIREYLPLLQQNPNAVSHIQVIDRRGRVVPRGAVNFAGYSARTFPYSMRQPPSDNNALGLVKFMFPNEHAIYLHDTPSKSLFAHDVRAYSHGCIRLADPFDFAYALMSVQSDNPQAEFKAHLDTGRETVVPLERPVPVHLVYFTAYPDAKGRMTYRRDVYGRDALFFDALSEAGVELPGVQG